MSVFMKINCHEVKKILNEKKQTEPLKNESGIRYHNFKIMSLIEKIEPESYVDFGFSKVIASYFDIPINKNVSRVTLDDFHKVNQTMSDLEKYLNDKVKTEGTLYLTRSDDDFCIMYYEMLNH